MRRERSVLGGSVLGCDDLAGGAISVMRVWDGAIEWVFWVWRMGFLGLIEWVFWVWSNGFDEWVFSIRRSAIEWVRQSRSRFLGSRFLFFLSLCASELFLSLALSLFCAWLGNGLKVKWNCKTISESNEQNFGQTEIIFRKFNFP